MFFATAPRDLLSIVHGVGAAPRQRHHHGQVVGPPPHLTNTRVWGRNVGQSELRLRVWVVTSHQQVLSAGDASQQKLRRIMQAVRPLRCSVLGLRSGRSGLQQSQQIACSACRIFSHHLVGTPDACLF